MRLSESEGQLLCDWLYDVRDQPIVGVWRSLGVKELDINFCGDLELRVFKFQSCYLAIASGGGQDTDIDLYQSLGDLSDWLKSQSQRGNREDGWEFDLKAFNKLDDLYPKLPSELQKLMSGEELAKYVVDDVELNLSAILSFND